MSSKCIEENGKKEYMSEWLIWRPCHWDWNNHQNQSVKPYFLLDGKEQLLQQLSTFAKFPYNANPILSLSTRRCYLFSIFGVTLHCFILIYSAVGQSLLFLCLWERPLLVAHILGQGLSIYVLKTLCILHSIYHSLLIITYLCNYFITVSPTYLINSLRVESTSVSFIKPKSA